MQSELRKVRLKAAIDMLRAEKRVKNRQMKSLLTDSEYVGYLDALNEQKELRQTLKEKPEVIAKYETYGRARHK